MMPSDYVGKSLRDLTKVTGFDFNGWIVFLLQSADDDTGRPMCEDIKISYIIRQHPNLADCVVKYSHGYFGQTVLRVLPPELAGKTD